MSEHSSLLTKLPLSGPRSFLLRNQIQIGKIVELNRMQAIGIQELFPNVVNTNKFVYSTLISQIAECETIIFIIGDEYGNACRVSIPGNADTSKLIVGVKLALCNPIYQISIDGKYTLVINAISDIYLIVEFPTPAAQTPTLFPSSTPSSFGVSPLQGGLLTSPQKKVDKPEPSLQFGVPYHSLFGEVKLIGQEQQQQPFEEELHSQFRIDLPQSPEIAHEDDQTLNSTGIKLFEEGRYLEAIVRYTSAIQTRDKVSDYYFNRAMCYFKMEYFEIALADFQKAFSITSNSAKYQYWIALTWSKIGNHKMSLDVLKKIKSIPREFLKHVDVLKRKENVFVENSDGKFDFRLLRQNVIDSKDNEIGDYIGPIQIQTTPDKGRGIFTTRKVLKGQNLCVVKAIGFSKSHLAPCCCEFCRKFIFEFYSSNDRLDFNLREKARKSKLTTVRLISLCDRSINRVSVNLYSGHGSEIASNFDTTKYPLDKLESLSLKNLSVDFDMLDLASIYGIIPISLCPIFYYGLWLLPSFINHSCIPNVVKLYIGDICIVRAITDIAEGDEIFCSYIPLDTFPTVESRKEFLKFTCNCKLCKYEKSPDYVDAFAGLLSLRRNLKLFVDPVKCEANRALQTAQNMMREDISRDKWFEFRNKLLKFAEILRLNESNHHISISFQNSFSILMRVCLIRQDILDFALEVEPYFSHFEPETFVTFWNSFYSHVKDTGNLENPRFKHVKAKYNQTRDLFT